MSMLRRWLVLFVLLAGCDPGEVQKTVLKLQILRGNAPPGIDRIELAVTRGATHFTVPLARDASAAEVELPQIVPIQLPAGEQGMIEIRATAFDAAGAELARGSTRGEVIPNQTLTLTLEFGKEIGQPMNEPDSGAPRLELDRGQHDFGDVVVGSLSAAASFRVQNAGSADADALDVTLDGPGAGAFALDLACVGVVLHPGESCAVVVTMRPDAAGASAATLVVSAAGSRLEASLTGRGLTASLLHMRPTMHDFGAVVSGTTGSTASFEIENAGQAASGALAVTLGGASAGELVIVSDNCAGRALPGLATCTVSVRLRPTSVGDKQATLTVSGAPGGSDAASLLGRGIAPAALAAPATQDAGVIVLGNSAAVTVTITNPGDAASGPLSSSLASTQGAAITSDGCAGTTLAARTSCTITVTLTPAAEGSLSTTLTVTGSPGGSASITLSASAVRRGELELSPVMQAFAPALVGSDGATHGFTVRNTGGAATGAIATTLGGTHAAAFRVVSDGCAGAPLAPAATCTITVRVRPNLRGSLAASLAVSATPGGTSSATLTGTGQAPATLVADGTTASFGTVDVSQRSTPFVWTLRNSGDVPSGALSTTVTGDTGELTLANGCAAPLGAGAACVISVTLAPTSGGAKSVTLTVSASPGGSVSLLAQGMARPLSVLTVMRSGNGAGTVTATPAGIDCGVTCTAGYVFGTPVTLLPAAAAGSTFTGWSGACTGTGPCSVTMNQAATVGASFTLQRYLLTVTTSGSGAVAGSGLTCNGATCTGSYDHGSTITLRATAATGWSFASWSGCAGASGATCDVTLTQTTSVGAVFAINRYPVTVSATGGGRVTSTPAGIACGATCSASFDYGTALTLTAAPDPDHHFMAWTGVCAGSGATCTVTLGTQPLSAGAQFAIDTHRITIGAPRGGTITPAPAGTACGAGCVSFDHGTTVTLTAAPAAGGSFDAWTGACAGQSAACSLSLVEDITVAAGFRFPLTTTTTGSGSVAAMTSATGSACGPGCTSYPAGSAVTLVPSAATGWSFSTWSGGCTGSSACSVTLDAPATVGASFTINPQRLTLSTPGGGSFTVTPAGSACGTGCTTHDHGTVVTVHPVPAAGASAGAWGGACAGTQIGQDCTLTLTSDLTASASFDFTVTTSTPGGGSITHLPAGSACGAGCSRHAWGTAVTLTATPAAGGSVGAWSGACAGSGGATCTVMLTQSRSAAATFRFPLTVSSTGQGTLSQGSASFDYGSSVSVSAAPATGWSFGGWSGACSGRAATCTVAMTQAMMVSALFTINSQTLTLSTPGGGTLSATPAGTSCGAGCATFDFGTVVTVRATPAGGASFGAWGGDCAGAGVDCVLTMNGNFSAAATFQHTVTATTPGGGSIAVASGTQTPGACGAGCTRWNYGSTVTLTPQPTAPASAGAWSGACAGTPAGQPCVLSVTANLTAAVAFQQPLTVTSSGSGSVSPGSGSFDHGSVLTLTPTAAPGWAFSAWSGACSGSGACTVTMIGARSVSASFSITQRDLTTNLVGQGTVTRSPAGTSCGTGCTRYDYDSAVTLSASAATGWTFSGWSGDCMGPSCALRMNQGHSVTATFTIQQRDLTTGVTGLGGFDLSPAGASCGAGCTRYDYGTTVTITPRPSTGWQFSSWGGDCANAGASCALTMNAAHAVSGSFTITTHELRTSVSSGSGTISNSPTGTSCGTGCQSYPYDTVVTLSATPGQNWVFAGWAGACTASPCQVRMTGARSVTASFTPVQRFLSTGVSGAGSIAVSPLRASYDHGSVVTLTANPGTGYSFSSWSGACAGQGQTCTLTMNSDLGATANFTPISYTLSLTGTGNGWGYSTSSPGGIDCGYRLLGTALNPPGHTACSATYTYGTVVNLTGFPMQQSEMYQSPYSGCDSVGGSSTQRTCQVTINGNRTVTQSFYGDGVDVAIVGQTNPSFGTVGHGYVTSTPTGISCGNDSLFLRKTCRWRFHWSSRVVLRYTVTDGSFNGWSGCDFIQLNANREQECVVDAYGVKNVTAYFFGGSIVG